MEGGEEGLEMMVDSKDLQQQSKALDKLTDHVEDRQLDSTRVQEAMASIAASAEADRNAMRIRSLFSIIIPYNSAHYLTLVLLNHNSKFQHLKIHKLR